MKGKVSRYLLIAIVVLGVLPSADAAVVANREQDSTDAARAKVLSYAVGKVLAQDHYGHVQMDDALSKRAFDLYFKELDGQKRFLLQEDLDRLKPFVTLLDNEMQNGLIKFPLQVGQIVNQRITEVQELVEELGKSEFDFSKGEELETDPEKLTYCRSQQELKERWRKILTLQVINRYLNMEEDEKGKAEKSGKPSESPESLRQKAKDKVLTSTREMFHRMLSRDSKDRYNRYFDAMARAYDPHSAYLPPTEKEDFDIRMRGSLEGIGAVLQEEGGYIKVMKIIPGGAADRQGELHVEDTILAVAQDHGEPVEITDMQIRDAVGYIRGKKGTQVRLTVKKADGSQRYVSIVRDVVQLEETFVKTTTLPDAGGNGTVGYLKIPSFYRDFSPNGHEGSGRNATDDVKRGLQELKGKKISGLIVDLRNNGGGALIDAVKIAGLFIKSGPIVQIKSTDNKAEIQADDDPAVAYEGPLLILVNKFSASASEIFAGALQDYNRAIVVGGEHTYGKGTVQSVLDLDRQVPFFNMQKYTPLGFVKVTTQKYYRVSGESTQRRGVVPNIVLPDRMQYVKIGEQYDDYSLPWDTVVPVAYERWRSSPPDLSAIVEKSRQRVSHKQEFNDILKSAAESKLRQEKTAVSLAIDKLRQERQAMKELNKNEPSDSFEHLDGIDHPPANKGDTTPAAEQKRWEEGLRKDPYLQETINVLDDLLAGNVLAVVK